MTESQKWPKVSQWVTAVLLILLGPLLAALFVINSGVDNEWTRALLNLIVAVLALLAAIAFGLADSIHGLDWRSQDRAVKWSTWIRMIGHSLLWASGMYLVAFTAVVLCTTPR